MMDAKRILVPGLVLLFAACGSSPPARFYSLQALDLAYQPDAKEAVVMYVGPLRLPEYLARPQIVTRGDGSEMLIDDYHRWAEPLEDAIPRIVAVNVDNLVEGVIVVAFPSSNVLESDYRLQGSIVRFDADATGRAVLIAQWGISKPDGDFLVPPRKSRYEALASPTGDPGAVATALNDTVAQFSREVAAEIEARLD
jgi:uncharacterized lipoprotein YmbA